MASTASSEEVTIVVEEKEILCDKDLLTKECDYFRAMFESCMIESQTNTVILQDQVIKTELCCSFVSEPFVENQDEVKH